MYTSSRMPQRKKISGFTIVELLIVIVVMGILAAIIIVAYNGVTQKARISVLKNDLSTASTQLEQYRTTGSSDQYPLDLNAAGLKASAGTSYQYSYGSSDNSYCLTGSNGGNDYYISSIGKQITAGTCPGHNSSGSGLPAGYEPAPLASGSSQNVDGYTAVQPVSCPNAGGSWIKVPGNNLYNEPNGFCVQQYPAVNVGGTATSQNTGDKWTALTQTDASIAASSVGADTHLLSEDEWMTIASNAAAQPSNWSGGAVGSGSLPTGSATASHGGVSLALSNGQRIYFDTGSDSYYSSREWTCYTGTSANNCGIPAGSELSPATAYYSDQFGSIASYGALKKNAQGYYYGDPRYANPSLGTYVTSSRNKGLGYVYSTYASGSSTVYGFSRGVWTGDNSSGLFSLYMNTLQNYRHAAYGFRAAK
jgi:prepilin-type N-terminal cleavage/methylation domain-containing protein